MNPDTRVNPIMCFSDRHTATHRVRTVSVTDGQNFSNARIPRPLENSVTIRVKAGIIEVSVRVNQHGISFDSLEIATSDISAFDI
jgi:hypothetical protein